MAVNVRNTKYNQFGTVDCEVEHPIFGWIPFTASPEDPDANGKAIYAAVTAAGDIAAYVPPDPITIIPERVTANQFGQQMIAAGIKPQVDAWIATQSDAVKWAYERSATFLRTDPMMQQGFADLGFTAEQIDQFFIDAAKIGVE